MSAPSVNGKTGPKADSGSGRWTYVSPTRTICRSLIAELLQSCRGRSTEFSVVSAQDVVDGKLDFGLRRGVNPLAATPRLRHPVAGGRGLAVHADQVRTEIDDPDL